MKHIYNPITRFLLVALSLMGGVAGGLTSCEHTVSILDIEAESELVIYAFPTTDDEYLVNVSLTRPTAGVVGTLDDVSVECTTNGRPDEVTFVHAENHFSMPMATYRVKGEHRSGDKISISVKASSLGRKREAKASTTIPFATPMDVTSVDTIYSDGAKLRFLLHASLPLTGGAGVGLAEGYYGTRLTSVYHEPYFDDFDIDNYYGSKPSDLDEVYHESDWLNFSPTRYSHLRINPSHEPLLNHYSDLNLDPWDEYYKCMYFFTSDDVRSSSQGDNQGRVVLHLQTDFPRQPEYIDVQFYTLSREYFLMLRHINDQLSNELAESGFAQTYSTYSNVHGGFGCVAAYACSHYLYTPPAYKGDEIYYGAE